MASFLKFGSYQSYKEDTMVFLEWLTKDAAASGCTLPPKQMCPTLAPVPAATTPLTSTPEFKTHAEKLQEKAAKKASKREEKKSQSAPKTASSFQQRPAASNLRIAETTNEVLRQAKAVANNLKIQVPANVLRVVVRAIRVRKRFAQWFISNKIENSHSNDGHQYFIWVLEEALRILKPRISKASGRKATTAPSHNVMTRLQRVLLEDDPPVEETKDIENIEDMEDILHESPNPPPAFANAEQSTEASSGPNFKKARRDESLNSFDSVFAVYCFFEDLHRIQEFLGETWRLYKNRQISLITASFTTNAALDIVRREEEIISNQLFSGDKNVPWEKIIALISEEDYSGDSEFVAAESRQTSQHGHFIYASVGLLLRRLKRDFRATGHGGILPPFEWYYRHCPDLLQLPETDVLKTENYFLAQALLEAFEKDECYDKSARPQNDPREQYYAAVSIPDMFTQRLEGFAKHGWLEIPFVFAARIVLDIQQILGGGAANGELVFSGALVAATEALPQVADEIYDLSVLLPTDFVFLQDTAQFLGDRQKCITVNPALHLARYEVAKHNEAVATKYHPWQSPDHSKQREKVLETLTSVWNTHNGMKALEFKHEYEQVLANLHLMPISSSTHIAYSTRHNLLHYGNAFLEITLRMERFNLIFANGMGSIFMMAHLYNAAHQTTKLRPDLKWRDMEIMFSIHRKTLFAGQLPCEVDQCRKRFMHTLGLSPRVYSESFLNAKVNDARNGRTPKVYNAVRPGYRGGPRLPCSQASSVIGQLYKDHEPISMERCLHELNQIVSKPVKSNPSPHTPHLSTVEFLSRIRDWLPAEIQQMQLDYMKLQQTCYRLLKLIRSARLTELQVAYPTNEWKEETQSEELVCGTMVGAMVSDILEEARDSWILTQAANRVFKNRANLTEIEKYEILKQCRPLDDLENRIKPGAPQLTLVGRILEEFLTGQLKATEETSSN